MRMSWLILTILLLAVLAGMGFAAWYSLAVPGRPHEGPLPSLTAEEQKVAGLLEQHVTAIA
jgi:ABC-type transporter Mla subunit MlaD